MLQEINVHALPMLVDPAQLADRATVIIDVLRGATTAVCALQSGIREIIPCVEVSEARSLVREMPDHDVILGGEREGKKIEGFDLGNSPSEYVPSLIQGKTLVFTTTNMTVAVDRAHEAEPLLIASFINAAAVVKQILLQSRVEILCAGTGGIFSEDDLLAAGLLVERAVRQSGGSVRLNPQAGTARKLWLDSFSLPQSLDAEQLSPEILTKRLRTTLGGRRLIQIGQDDDILAAAQLDSSNIVPFRDQRTGRIRC